VFILILSLLGVVAIGMIVYRTNRQQQSRAQAAWMVSSVAIEQNQNSLCCTRWRAAVAP
jgi:hypothetical protein